MNLKALKAIILYTVDDKWSNLEKIRFAYILSAFYLKKHTDFYLTLENKTNDRNLKKIDRIYEGKLKKDEWDKMICKSAASFLKSVYDEMGITSYLVETNDAIKMKGLKNDIHHYFLCVNDGEFNYFLTPAADYAYIQNLMSTKHFGTDIAYKVFNTEGEEQQVYKSAEEIPHRVLTPKELKEIDEKIGYTTTYSNTKETKSRYVDEIILNNKDTYLDLLEQSTKFYNVIFPKDENLRIIKSFVAANESDWYKLINVICLFSGKRICEMTNKEYAYSKFIKSKEDLDDWYKYIGQILDEKEYDSKKVIYKNPVLLFNKTKSLCDSVVDFYKKNVTLDSLKDETLSFRSSFNKKIKEISKHFIDSRFLIEPENKKDYVPSSYVHNRFLFMFPHMFDVNNGLTDFNRLSFSEQIETVKYMIQLMFNDIPDSSLLRENDVDTRVKPIFRRVNIFSMRERETENYGCYFSITDSNSDTNSMSYWYKYEFSNNEFSKTSLSRIAIECSKNGKYEILSNRLKNTLSELENKGYKKM